MNAFTQFDLSLSHAFTDNLVLPNYRLFVWLCAQYLVVIPVISLLVLWFWPHKKAVGKAQQTVVITTVICAVLLAIKAVVVWVVLRERPFVVDPSLYSLDITVDPGSLPSGHTMLAFGIAASILLAGYRQLGRWLLIVALLVAFGRVAAGVHFVSDVLAGAVLGVVVAWILHHESGTLKRYLPNE